MPRSPLPDVEIRPAQRADAMCIGVLGAQVFLDTYAADGIRPSLAEEVLAHFSADAISALLSEPDVGFIVAERAAHLAGFAQLRFACGYEHPLDLPAAKLERLYVQRPFFGRGIGKALLRRAEALAASRGASALWLTAWAGNDRALAFYARQGYEDVGSTVYTFQREQYENRVFTKSLPTPAAD